MSDEKNNKGYNEECFHCADLGPNEPKNNTVKRELYHREHQSN